MISLMMILSIVCRYRHFKQLEGCCNELENTFLHTIHTCLYLVLHTKYQLKTQNLYIDGVNPLESSPHISKTPAPNFSKTCNLNSSTNTQTPPLTVSDNKLYI